MLGNNTHRFLFKDGESMKQLEELEKRINLILEANKNLRSEVDGLKKETEGLQAANGTLENSLLHEHSSISDLNKEKDAIKVAIEALLENIDKLEEVKS